MRLFSMLVGGSLVMLALVAATGSVSLGSTTYPIGNGQEGQTTWLVYSPWVFLLSIIIAVAGIAVIYLTAQDDRRLARTTQPA